MSCYTYSAWLLPNSLAVESLGTWFFKDTEYTGVYKCNLPGVSPPQQHASCLLLSLFLAYRSAHLIYTSFPCFLQISLKFCLTSPTSSESKAQLWNFSLGGWSVTPLPPWISTGVTYKSNGKQFPWYFSSIFFLSGVDFAELVGIKCIKDACLQLQQLIPVQGRSVNHKGRPHIHLVKTIK